MPVFRWKRFFKIWGILVSAVLIIVAITALTVKFPIVGGISAFLIITGFIAYLMER